MSVGRRATLTARPCVRAAPSSMSSHLVALDDVNGIPLLDSPMFNTRDSAENHRKRVIPALVDVLRSEGFVVYPIPTREDAP